MSMAEVYDGDAFAMFRKACAAVPAHSEGSWQTRREILLDFAADALCHAGADSYSRRAWLLQRRVVTDHGAEWLPRWIDEFGRFYVQ